MQALVFADITNRRLTSALGGNQLTFPSFVQGDKVRLGLRFSASEEGSTQEIERTVQNIRASIGFVDARPEAGSFVLRIGAGPYVQGTNQTAPIPHNASAVIVQNALIAIGISNASVADSNGSWIVSNAGAAIALTGASASGLAAELSPLSFCRIRSSQVNSQYRYEVRLMQAPLASTAAFELIVPPAPSVSRVQEGGSSSTTVWPEIQALKLLPSFRGTYQIRRGFKKTAELSIDDGPEQILAALAPLADDGGTFTVSNPATNIAHITFGGSMEGIAQDLLEIAVFSAPAGDPTITLDLNTAEISAALRGADEIKPVLEIEVTVEDENDDEVSYVLTPFRAPITLIRELNWDGLETSANIDWLRPPHGRSYVPFTPDQIITGSQHYVTPVGDGINDELEISHNLGTRDLHVTIRRNGGDFGVVDDVIVLIDDEDFITLSFPDTPDEDEYVATITTAGPVSAFQAHTHTIAQIEGLQAIIDDLGSRIEDMEAFIPSASFSVGNINQTIVAAWDLPDIFEVFPTRTKLANKALPDIKPADLPREGGLLPAVYPGVDPDPTETAIIPASPALDTIYEYTGDDDAVSLPGYLGRRSYKLQSGDLFAWDGRGFFAVSRMSADEDVFYPSDFDRELFRIHINAKQLRLSKSLRVDFSFVAAVFKSNTAVQWGVAIDIGIPSAAPASPDNLEAITFLPPSLDHTFMLTAVPSSHSFGLRIRRALVDAVETFTVDRSIYGALEATDTELDTANFILRARLVRFDTENHETDPRGLVAFEGLKATLVDGGDESEFGKATIQ